MHERSSAGPSAALVLETNNLRGGAASNERVTSSLIRLLDELSCQSRAPSTLAEMVITHHGLPAPQRAEIRAAARANVRFVELDPGTGYYDAKNLGFAATSADVVAFADADCLPDRRWLERLLAPFAEPEVCVVSGRTTYRDDVLGQAASAIDFMYFETRGAERATRNFYANNVAFRREIFAAHPFAPLPDTYRGHCQVLGMRLHRQGISIRFVPEARTVHRFPDTLAELVTLRRLRGADTISVTPHLIETYLPRAAQLGRRHSRLAPLGVLAARLACSWRAIGRQDMERLGPLQEVACALTVLGITAFDASGVVRRPKALADNGAEPVLSYHRDVAGQSRQDRRPSRPQV